MQQGLKDSLQIWTQGSCSNKPWTDEHNVTRSIFMLCSAADVVFENQLTVACPVLVALLRHNGALFVSLKIASLSICLLKKKDTVLTHGLESEKRLLLRLRLLPRNRRSHKEASWNQIFLKNAFVWNWVMLSPFDVNTFLKIKTVE